MRTSRRTVLLLVVLGGLVCLGVVSGTAAGNQDSPLAQTDIDADSVLIDVSIAADGSAEWQVVYRMQLESDAEIRAFEELQADIGNDTAAYLGPFEERMRGTVGSAENATGREMAAEEFAVNAERRSQPQSEFGVVTFSFEWVGFAVVEDDTVRAGDGLDRLFLDEDTSLRFRWPAEYTLESGTPTPDDAEAGRVTWRGPVDFGSGEPRVVLVADGAGDTPTDTPTDTGTDGTGAGEDGSFSTLSLLVVGALVAVAVVAWFLLGRSEGGAAGAAGADGTDSDDGPPPELLSNEERVLKLLERNDGRMKQKAVAERLDWTAAKTSQVVGELRDADELESFRLGRENVLTLPDVDLETPREDSGDDG